MDQSQDRKTKIDWSLFRTRLTVAVPLTLIIMAWFAFEGFFQWVPFHPQRQPVAPWLILMGPLWYLLLRSCQKLEKNDPELANLASFLLRLGDWLKIVLVRCFRPFFYLIILGILGVCLIWVPEYLVQPLWTDHEHVLVMARLWDLGQFPWTNMLTYQFPGEMEFAWLSAKLFGWGNPIGFYMLDMILNLIFVIALLAWSNRQLGNWKFAVSGILGMLAIELSLPFTNVAQRDTHTALMAMLAFCLPGALRSVKWGTALSAIAFGFGLAIRPHMVLFLPMILCGLVWAFHSNDREILYKQNRKKLAALLGLWMIVAVAASCLFLSPVLGPRHSPDFMAALRFPFQQEGAYAEKELASYAIVFRDLYRVSRHFWFISISLLIIAIPSQQKWRLIGLFLVFMGISGMFYRAVHPVDHGYLQLPLQLLECLGLVIITAWLVDQSKNINGWMWLSLCGLTCHVLVTSLPLYIEASYAPKAVRYLLDGTDPGYSPPGARAAYPNAEWIYHYDWIDWVRATDWLRLETKPDTKILNILSFQPFPPFCATIDRLPLGPTESIVLMNWFTNRNFEPDWIKALEQAPPGSLVAWDNHRMNLPNLRRLGNVVNTIEKLYQPRAKFGEIEFWEKRPE